MEKFLDVEENAFWVEVIFKNKNVQGGSLITFAIIDVEFVY